MSTTLSGNHEPPKNEIPKRRKVRPHTPLSCKIEYFLKTILAYFLGQSAFFTDDARTQSRVPTTAVVARLDRAIQYAAAPRLNRNRLWNTGSPGQAGR
jgi:hypothetical protein